MAFNDVVLTASGFSTNLAPNPGFENGNNWTSGIPSTFPNKHVRRYYHTPDRGRTHSGDSQHYGHGITNHGYGYLASDLINVSPSVEYQLKAWLRGQIDPEDSTHGWIIRAYFYDGSSSYIGYTDVETGYTATDISTSWEQKGGAVVAPANAATMRIHLYGFNIAGWVTFDDVTLSSPNTVTKYYMHGSRRVAMRRDENGMSNVYYLLDDHLSTTSTVINSSGNNVSESRHYPFGDDRWTSGTNT